MNPRTTLVLAVLVGLLCGLTWWQLQRESTGVLDPDLPLFPGLDTSRVQSLRIDNLELDLYLLIGARRVGDVEPTLLVEVGRDGAIDQRWPGDALYDEPFGHGEARTVRVRLWGVAIPRGRETHQESRRGEA